MGSAQSLWWGALQCRLSGPRDPRAGAVLPPPVGFGGPGPGQFAAATGTSVPSGVQKQPTVSFGPLTGGGGSASVLSANSSSQANTLSGGQQQSSATSDVSKPVAESGKSCG